LPSFGKKNKKKKKKKNTNIIVGLLLPNTTGEWEA